MSNIGFPLTEFVLEAVIRDGLGELRANPDRLDDLFSRFTEAQFNNQYGQAKIDEIKTYITGKQIKIVQAYTFQPTVMPCYSIQILSTDESDHIQNLGRHHDILTDAKNREIILEPVTSTAYDTVTGKFTLDPGTDLSTICPNQIFIDDLNNEFKILSGISNASGNKFINIGSGKEPVLGSNGQIVSSIDFTAHRREMVRLAETIRIGIHAKDDIHLTKYLYYILYYILRSRQESLINRGVHLDAGLTNIFDRSEEFQGENVFSRYFDMRCLTEFNWNQEEVAAADCFDVNVATTEDC